MKAGYYISLIFGILLLLFFVLITFVSLKQIISNWQTQESAFLVGYIGAHFFPAILGGVLLGVASRIKKKIKRRQTIEEADQFLNKC
jgi:TRAP-type C4-dicarboxylate transport system permease small subunit